MASTGFQIQVGAASSSASLPWVPRGGGDGGGGGVGAAAGVRRTQLHLPVSGAACSLRRRSCRDTQFSALRRRVSKCRIESGPIGGSVSPRSRLEELSTAEELGGRKEPTSVLNEEAIIRGSSEGEEEESSSAPAADKEEGGSFNWLAQWYPVGVLKHMDKIQPHPVTILGRELVMWWDRSGAQWQVFADACPHRLAPLSEGRINEQGHLQCSYHGWSFAPSSGACTMIPQASQTVFEGQNPKRSCAVVYPSKEHQGLLWVYMDTSVGAEELAGNPPPFLPILSDPDFVYDMGMSDVSYSYTALIENLLDPAHVPFAHHGIQGRRESAKPLDIIVQTYGITGIHGRIGDLRLHDFIAPCIAKMDFILAPPTAPQGHPWALKLREFIMSKGSGGDGSTRQISTVFFCVPLSPEKSRVFFAFPRNFAKVVHKLFPRWWGHLAHMAVIDSDMMILHLMERRLEDRGGMKNIEKLFYCPTKSDSMVVSYRRWLKQFGSSVPDYGPKATNRLPPSLPETVLLDRQSLHVEHCTYCSGAVRNLRLLESVLSVLPFILIGLVAGSNTRALRGINGFSIPLLCTALISHLASRWLQTWIKKNYEFHGYNHALVK